MGQPALHYPLRWPIPTLRSHLGSYGWFWRKIKDSEAQPGYSPGKKEVRKLSRLIEAYPYSQKPASESDYLYELDKISQEVVSLILDWQKDHPGEGGGEVKIADASIQLPPNPISLPQLQRIRRQFISLNRVHDLPKQGIRNSFLEYLQTNLGWRAAAPSLRDPPDCTQLLSKVGLWLEKQQHLV